MSKFILSFVYILMMLVLGGLVPNASFAASPFLVKHTSIEQLEQSGQGRAAFVSQDKADELSESSDSSISGDNDDCDDQSHPKSYTMTQSKKPVTLAESLINLRQHQSSGQHKAQPEPSSEATSATQSQKIFLVQPQK